MVSKCFATHGQAGGLCLLAAHLIHSPFNLQVKQASLQFGQIAVPSS